MFKVFLWDIDGTVLNFKAAEEVALLKCFEIFNLGECTPFMMEHYSTINKKYWEALEKGQTTKPKLLVDRFKEFFSNYEIDVNIASDFNSEFQNQLGETAVFFDDVEEIIKSNKGKRLQCAVTNGTKIAQIRKLTKSNLINILDYIFISEDVGIEKPNKEYFEYVLSHIGDYSKKDILIIGDSLTSDIQGGNNIGIKTCWFNPKHVKNDKGVIVDYEIDSFKQLKDIVC